VCIDSSPQNVLAKGSAASVIETESLMSSRRLPLSVEDGGRSDYRASEDRFSLCLGAAFGSNRFVASL
jgi:hypothetical protein